MEQDNARRRSSRLAAKGVTTPSRVNSSAKKIPKSVEKPTPSKRSKRKIGEVALPDAKKNKIAEEEKPSDDVIENNFDNNEIIPMEVEEIESSSEIVQNVKSSEEKTIDGLKNDLSDVDEKEKENDVEKKQVNELEKENEIEKEDEIVKEDEIEKEEKIEKEDEVEAEQEIEKEKEVEMEIEIDEEEEGEVEEGEIEVEEKLKEKPDNNKIPEETVSDSTAEPRFFTGSTENDEPKTDDVIQDTKSKRDPSVLNPSLLIHPSNGNDNTEKVVEEKFKNDVCQVKDVTPNGETNEAIEANTTNGNDLETVEQTTKVVLADVEPDVKAAIPPPAANSINDADELEEVAETVTVTPDDKTPNVDQSTTIVS